MEKTELDHSFFTEKTSLLKSESDVPACLNYLCHKLRS